MNSRPDPKSHAVHVELPRHLCALAKIDGVIILPLQGCVTQRAILDQLEVTYPALRGTLRDQVTKARRPFIRFFACGLDLSHDDPDEPLPTSIADGTDPFLIVGAIAGG